MQDHFPYYSPDAFVYVGEHALELGAIWDGVEAAEHAGVALNQIGLALTHNWTWRPPKVRSRQADLFDGGAP